MENLAKQANADLNPSLKLAIAMAIVESRRRKKFPPSSTTDAARNADSQVLCGNNSESDAIKWKRKVYFSYFLTRFLYLICGFAILFRSSVFAHLNWLYFGKF